VIGLSGLPQGYAKGIQLRLRETIKLKVNRMPLIGTHHHQRRWDQVLPPWRLRAQRAGAAARLTLKHRPKQAAAWDTSRGRFASLARDRQLKTLEIKLLSPAPRTRAHSRAFTQPLFLANARSTAVRQSPSHSRIFEILTPRFSFQPRTLPSLKPKWWMPISLPLLSKTGEPDDPPSVSHVWVKSVWCA
jgi:hypothetical protein